MSEICHSTLSVVVEHKVSVHLLQKPLMLKVCEIWAMPTIAMSTADDLEGVKGNRLMSIVIKGLRC